MTPPDWGGLPDLDGASGPRLMCRLASTITPTRPEWAWRPWLLTRAVNVTVGRQGTGKSTLAAHVVAALTRGAALPGDGARPPVRVGVLSLEEAVDRVAARLHAADADLERAVVLGDVADVIDDGHPFRRRWMLPKDIGVLGEAIAEHHLALVVVDGLGFAIPGESNNYAIVGSALAALAGEAERTGAALWGLMHTPKGPVDAAVAAIGSTAWTAIPRVAMVLGFDPNDEREQTRVLAVGKSNYKMPDSSLAFEIAEDPRYECGRVVGFRPSDVRADDVTMTPRATPAERTERVEARELLAGLLLDGPMDARDVEAAAEQAGISRRTLFRARKALCIVATPHRSTDGRRIGGWTLALPTEEGGESTVPPTVPAGPVPDSWHSWHAREEQGKRIVSPKSASESGTGGLGQDDEPS